MKRINSLRLIKNGIYIGNSNGLVGVDYEKMLDSQYVINYSGTPTAWALYGSKIYFNAFADQDYTLSMAYNVGDLVYPSADSDISIWFNEGQDIIRYHAMGVFYNDNLHSAELAQPCFELAKGYLNNLLQRNVNSSSSNGILS